MILPGLDSPLQPDQRACAIAPAPRDPPTLVLRRSATLFWLSLRRSALTPRVLPTSPTTLIHVRCLLAHQLAQNTLVLRPRSTHTRSNHNYSVVSLSGGAADGWVLTALRVRPKLSCRYRTCLAKQSVCASHHVAWHKWLLAFLVSMARQPAMRASDAP